MSDFAVLMNNEWARSECATPDLPSNPRPDETLLVEREGQILKVAATSADEIHARIYARLFFETKESATFSIMPTLPPGVVDDKFFPANGTVVLFQEDEKLRLKAVGTDRNSGACGGWIFDATQNS